MENLLEIVATCRRRN